MTNRILDTDGLHAITKARHGLFIYNKFDNTIGRSMALYGEWSEPEVSLFSQFCRPGATVVEAGANMGSHTVPLARMVGRGGVVHAFEPQRVIFQELCGNLSLNNLTNARCYPMAVGEKRGEVLIPDIAYDRPSNFGAVQVGAFGFGEPVPVVSVDEFVPLERLDLLKIDVERMELEVINGAEQAIRRFRPVIYTENNQPDLSAALMKRISDLGYDIYWHMPRYFNPGNFAGNSENVFKNYVSYNILCIPQDGDIHVDGGQAVTDFDAHPLRRDA